MFCCGPLPVLRRGGRHNPGSGIGSFFSFDLLRAVFYFSLQLQYITLHSRKINVSWKNNFEKYFRKTCRTRSWGVVRNFSGSRGVWRGKSFCFFPSVSCPAGEGGERRLLVSFLSRDISIALIPSFICFFFFFFLFVSDLLLYLEYGRIPLSIQISTSISKGNLYQCFF